MKQNHKRNNLGMFLISMAAMGCVLGFSLGGVQAAEQEKEQAAEESKEKAAQQPAEKVAEESTTETKKVVATVNGQPIYEVQLKPLVDRERKKLQKFSRRKNDPNAVNRLQKKALGRLIEAEVMNQEAWKLVIEDIDEKIQQRVDDIKKIRRTPEGFEQFLKMKNMTEERLKKTLAASVRMDEYFKQQGVKDPEIPEQRIREFYDARPDNYAVEEAVKVSHVLIKVEDAGQKEEARQKAEGIRQEILDGKDFAEMAKEHSDCNSASGGGDLRYIKKGFMPKEFENVAFALEEDAVSEVVETKFGFHIIKLFKKRHAGVTSYENVKDFIEKFMQQDESKKKLAELKKELKGQAKIEIFLDKS